MLHILSPEVTLSVLSHLPIPSLLSLPVLSRQWLGFFAVNQSAIFHSAALLHGYIQPETLLLELEDTLSQAVNTGMPWAGSTSWKDFCHRSFQLNKNWEGKGRAVARVLSPPDSKIHHIKVDEKAGIYIATHIFGGLSVIHLFSRTVLWCLPQSYLRFRVHCEYDNGYLVFNRRIGEKEVWRLASDFSEGQVATHSPPDDEQMDISARAAMVYHQYTPRGQFRPWALMTYPEPTYVSRLVYPTLICANYEQAFLHDIRTGSLVQIIDINLRTLFKLDVNERHAFVCEPNAVHVFSRESGSEVLRIPADATVQCSQFVEDPALVIKDEFITPVPVSPRVDKSRPKFMTAHVSRDGRDLVVLSYKHRVLFIRDFERICRGETSLEQVGISLSMGSKGICCYLGFEHGRVSVATFRGIYIFTFGPDLSAKAVYVRHSNSKNGPASPYPMNCMQLTDRRIYFTWEDARRRQDLPLFEDVENAQELPPPMNTPTLDQEFQWAGQFGPMISVGCIDFTLMPEDY